MSDSRKVKSLIKLESVEVEEIEIETHEEKQENQIKRDQESIKARHDFAIILQRKCQLDLANAIIKDLDNCGFD
jgi:hypothetical protein